MSFKFWLSCFVITLIRIDTVYSQGWIYNQNVDGWIKAHKVIATYDEAEELCDRDGSVIASPITKELLTEIRTIMTVNNHTAEYYIGVKAKYHPRLYEVNGVSIDDMPVTEMIERIDPLDGSCLAMSKSNIRAIPCNSSLPYICYKKKKSNARTNSGRFKNCRTDYYSSNITESCYKIHKDRKSWYEAHFVCNSEGGHLAIVNSYQESRDIMDTLMPLYEITSSDQPAFVGWRFENKKWRTIFGETLEEVYHDYLHNYKGPGTACATMAKGLEMRHAECDNELFFLCEINPNVVRFPEPTVST